MATVNGTSGNDVLGGTSADDQIFGFDGRDSLRGFQGNDVLNGGSGGDRASYDEDIDFGGLSGVTVNLTTGIATDGFGDTDTLISIENVRGTNFADTITGDTGFNFIQGLGGNDIIDGVNGNAMVAYARDASEGGLAGVTVNLTTGIAIDGFGDTDTISNVNDVQGTNQADTLIGNNNFNFFEGLAGNDIIDGVNGGAKVSYSQDADFGGNAGVTVNLTTGTATDGFGDTDTLSNINEVRGTNQADTIIGNTDFNFFEGLAGNDIIDGVNGDAFVSYLRDADFGGNAGVTVNLTTGVATDGFGDTDTLSNIKEVRGTNQADTLIGNTDDNFFQGLAGNDIIDGVNGNAMVSYDRDAREGGGAGVTVNLTTGTATDGFGDTDTLSNVGAVRGTNQADTLIGNTNFNFFQGLAGNDIIDGVNGDAMVSYRRDASFGGNSGVTVNLQTGTATDGFGDTDTISNVRDIEGTNANDVLIGDGAFNFFSGLAGNDVLDGGSGGAIVSYIDDARNGGSSGVTVNLTTGTATDGFGDTDTLNNINEVLGTNQGDTLTGNTNFNIFEGFAGNDVIDGVNGDAMVSYRQDARFGGNSGVTVNLQTGTATDGFGDTDTISNVREVEGTNANDTIIGDGAFNFFRGLGGNDVLDGGSGGGFVDYADDARFGGNAGVIVNLTTGTATDGFGDTDTLINIGEVRGTDQADMLTGNNDFNFFQGLAGNDIIDGINGDAMVSYTQDARFGGNSGVTVNLTTGIAIDGFGDTDTISNVNEVEGTNFADTLTGNADRDFFRGLGGDDVIDGVNGDAMVSYGRDADFGGGSGVTVNLTTGTATDGFGDTDTLSNISYVRGTNSVDTIVGNDTFNFFQGLAGNDFLDGVDGEAMAAYDRDARFGGTAGVTVNLTSGTAIDGFGDTDTLANINSARGTEQSDTLTGSNTDNTLEGRGGNDTLIGGNGIDTLLGGDNNDILDGGFGFDTIDGGDGEDTATYEFSPNSVNVNLNTGVGTGAFANGDTLVDIENVIGSAAADTLTGSFFANKLTGNSGDDRLFGLQDDDVLDGGFGFDRLDGGSGEDTATYEFSPNSVNVNLKTGTGVGAFANGDTLISIENVIGSSVGDTLTGSDFANDLTGNGGNDRLFGLQGNDVLNGGAGRDRIEGGNGTDELIGGIGDDTLEGGGQGDILNGDVGFDLARYLSSGSGVTVNLNTGTASGGHAAGDSFISIENVTGSFFNDTLTGDNDRNELNGRNGNDKLSGLAGADILRGGGGQDVLSGGGGDDTLLGGGGNDIFEFGGNFGDDIISDFEDGLDRIKMFGFTAGDLTLATQGSDVLLTTTNGNSILFENTALSELTGFGDFDFV